MKALVWSGAVVTAIGVAILAMFVIPHVGAPDAVPGLNGLTQDTLPAWAVIVSSFGLAVGSALIGIGVGRWQHPRDTHTPSLGQTRDGSEIRRGRTRFPSRTPDDEDRPVPPRTRYVRAARVWMAIVGAGPWARSVGRAAG